jgi:hypothetical protein
MGGGGREGRTLENHMNSTHHILLTLIELQAYILFDTPNRNQIPTQLRCIKPDNSVITQ